MIGSLATAWGFVRSPIGRALGAGLIAVLALGYAYMKGAESEAGKCEAAALRAQIDTLRADLRITMRAAEKAASQEAAAQAREAILNERLQSYEGELHSTPAACLLSPGDVDSLRKLTR